jgi:tellurite resistance protein TerC
MPLESIGSPALWVGFIVFVLAMLALDLGVFHKAAHRVSLKEAAVWSVVWVSLAAVFNVGVYYWFGPDRALEFTTGYLIEKALSVDNIFVFLVLFSFFAVPDIYQHRVLFWGVLGALIMRAIFIFAGGAFLAKFHWAIYVFGGILALTGLKLLRSGDEQVDPEKNFAVRFLRKFVPVTNGYRGDKFFVRENGVRMATPLFLCLVAVEATDLVFAVDSIPAIFAVTRDPFIVFTSNIFAILGLRSLFFLLAGVMDRFVYLKTGLAFVLLFVGGKMLVMDWYKVPVLASLGIVFGILAVAVVASLLVTRRKPDENTPTAPPTTPPATSGGAT